MAEDLNQRVREGSPAPVAVRGVANPNRVPKPDPALGIAAFQAMDRMREALSGQVTGGLSPGSLALAGFDWAFHLVSAPG